MKQNTSQRQSVSRRDQITQIAAKLFADKGYHGATLDEVARQLDITRAALYYHIDSKEEVLREICDKVMKAGIRDSRKILRSSLSPRDKLRMYIRDQIIASAERKELCAVLFEQSDALNTRARKAVQRQKRTFDQILLDILKEGVEQGYFAIDDVRIASFAILGACFWTYHWYRSDGRLTPDEIADRIIKLLENGYLKRPAKGLPAEQRSVAQQSLRRSSKDKTLAKVG